MGVRLLILTFFSQISHNNELFSPSDFHGVFKGEGGSRVFVYSYTLRMLAATALKRPSLCCSTDPLTPPPPGSATGNMQEGI